MSRKPKNKKRRVGIIGCGRVFPRHVEAIESNPYHFELVAVCDIDETTLRNRKKIYNVPGFKDYKDMLAKMKGKMDFVVIATPNVYHYDQIMDALKAGYDVLVEKPVDFKSKRVKEIGNLANWLNY